MGEESASGAKEVALDAVREATTRRDSADAAAAAAREEQSIAIRAAIAVGVPVSTIQSVTGFSHARVYQIRDGRR